MKILNLNDGDTISYHLPLFIGDLELCCQGDVTVWNSSCKKTNKIEWPIVDGRFKALVKLVCGKNLICIERGSELLTLTLFFHPPLFRHYVRPVYIICSDDDGYFQGPDDEDCSPQCAQEKITLAAMLIQSFTAEKMSEHGFQRTTFQLEHGQDNEPGCKIFQSKLNRDEAHSMTGDELWSYFAKELIEFDSASKDYCGGGLALFGTGSLHTWARSVDEVSQRFTDNRKIDRRKFMDDSANRKGCIQLNTCVGHHDASFYYCDTFCTAPRHNMYRYRKMWCRQMSLSTLQGGGGLALFGTGSLHTWARSVNEVSQRFTDNRKIDRRNFMDDSANRQMSLSTLKVPYRIIQYDKKAFPRFQQTQQRITDTVQDLDVSIYNYAKDWTLNTEDPHIVFCYGTSPPAIDVNEFAVLNVPLEKKKNHTLKSISDEAVPVLLICVIKSFSCGYLTYDDCSMLNGIRNLPNDILENTLFVIDRSRDSLTATSVYDVSEQITAELKLNTNDIYHRVFMISDSNIGIRASLYFEKQLLYRYRTIKSKLQHTVRCLRRFVIFQTKKELFDDYETFLHYRPFHYQNSWRFISDAALEYRWDGDPMTRNKWTVDKAKHDIAHYICDKFGNHIAEALIEKFESDLQAKDLGISNYLLANIDVSGIRQAFFTYIVFYLFEMIFEGIIAVLTVVRTFIFTENLNNRSFRYKIANNVYDQIMEKRVSLISCIVKKFWELHLHRINETWTALNSILIETASLPESRNEMDCYYHELKMIASRRDHILAIGYDGGNFCVYVQNRSVKAPEIYNYLSNYLKNVGQVEVREFKSICVNEFSKLQSGDKIVRCPLNNRYGTLGFLLRDEADCYCATCRHVTAGYDTNKLHVELLDGSIITATDKYEPSSKLDFAVLKLDRTFLSGYTWYTGVRNKYEKFVPGRVFMNDEFTLHPQTPVYKWGSTTTLTLGLYKETYEILEHTEDSYPWIIIANDNNRNNVSFAEGGDSGSLVCFTERDSEVALCLLIGSYSDPGTFACCRIADGLSLIKKEIPDINHLFHD